jgi:hypothetical protein
VGKDFGSTGDMNILGGIKNILDSTPVQGFLDVISAPLRAVGAGVELVSKVGDKQAAYDKAMQGLSPADQVKYMQSHAKDLTSAGDVGTGVQAAIHGLTDTSQKTPGQILSDHMDPNSNAFKKFAVQFGTDVALDPINFIPFGKLADAVKSAKTAKPEATAAVEHAATEAPTHPIDTSWYVHGGAHAPAPVSKEVALRAPSDIAVPTSKAVAVPTSKAVEISPQVRIDSVVGNTPKPNLEQFLSDYVSPVGDKARFVSSPVGVEDTARTVTLANEDLARRLISASKTTPKLAHPGLGDIPAPFKQVEIDAETAMAADRSVSVRRAIKMGLLQNDQAVVSGIKMGQWQKHIAANPEAAGQFDKVLNEEVNRLYKTKEFRNMDQKIKTFTKSGDQSPLGITMGQAATLIKSGSYKHLQDAGTIFGPEDMKNIYIRNSSGEHVTLDDYLKNLGITAHGNDPIPQFMPTGKITKIVKLDRAESVNWAIQHGSKLSPQELKYLSDAADTTQFTKRLNELKVKELTGDFKSVDDFITALDSGIIPEATAKKIFKEFGVRNSSGLRKKAEAAIKATGERGRARVAPLRTDVPKPMRKYDNVLSPQEHIAAGTHVQPVIQATDQIVSDVAKVLPKVVADQVATPAMIAKYPWLAKLKSEASVPKAHFGKNPQADLFRGLVKEASKRSVDVRQGLAAKKDVMRHWAMRPKIMYDEVVPALKAAEDLLSEAGVKITTGVESGIPLTMSDVLTALPRKSVEDALFVVKKGVGSKHLPTEILDAAEHLVMAELHGSGTDVAREAALKVLKGNEDLVKDIEKAMPDILNKVNSKYADYAVKLGSAVEAMTDNVVTSIITKFTDPSTSVADSLRSLMERGSIARPATAPKEASSVTRAMVDGELAAKGIDNGSLAEANLARQMSHPGADTASIGRAQQASRAAEVEAQLPQHPEFNIRDIEQVRLLGGIFRANVPVTNKLVDFGKAMGQAFYAPYGMKDFHQLVWAERNVTTAFSRTHRKLMEDTWELAHSLYGKDASARVNEALKYLQHGTEITDESMAKVMESMRNSVDIMFGGGKASFAARNGYDAFHLNGLFDYYGVPGVARFDSTKPLVDQLDAWKSWDGLEDPLDALDRMHAAYQTAAVHTTVAREFGKFGSKVAKPGLVKIVDKGLLKDKQSQSLFYRLIDSNLYYPKEIAEQVPAIDRMMRGASYKPRNETLRNMLDKYDWLLHAWKSGVTIYRVGHHISNLMGDLTLSHMAGVDNPIRYKDSIRILAGRSAQYSDWDGLKALQSMAPHPRVVMGKPYRYGKFDLVDDQVWRYAYKQGLLPDYRTLEQLDLSNNTLMAKMETKNSAVAFALRQKNAIRDTAGEVSQARDHFVRIAHFTDALSKSKAATLEEAVAEAGAAVRKWHPDGSDLTPFERQVMRRLIPFYSWLRKSTPLIAEAAVTSPGRFMTMPKAMQSLANSMGIDPNSLGDPFPQNSLYPSYLTDSVYGPQWTNPDNGHAMGMGLPGDPVAGFNQTTANPLQTILQGLSPAIRIPTELATGSSMGTGVPIKDKTDYVDSQIPIVSSIANITNKSAVSGFTQDQSPVAKKIEQPGIDRLALINWLTGAGVRDFDKMQSKRAAVSEVNRSRGR